jgi:uncharacterized membrane protein YesL
MALTQAQKTYWTGAAVIGAVLALLFGILAANASAGNQGAYIAACVVCALIAAASAVVLLTRR